MCGISAFTTSNPDHDVATILYEAEREMAQSRGDASWGLVIHVDAGLLSIKGLGPPVAVQVGLALRKPNRRQGMAELDPVGPTGARAGIAHNRLPSMGRVSLENAHPFVAPDGTWALAHNGHVPGDIPYDAERFHPRGQTDSERILYYFLTLLRAGLDLPRALREVMRLPGRTNVALLGRDGEVAVLASDSLYRMDGPDFVLYASIPVTSISLGVSSVGKGWRKLQRGTVERARGGRIESSAVVTRPAPSAADDVRA